MSYLPIYNANGNQIGDEYNDAPEMIHKTAEVLHVYTGNVVDTTGKTAPGTSLDDTIHFKLENDTYYANPFSTSTGKSIYIAPKDKNGNAIYFTKKDGTRANYLESAAHYLCTIAVDDLNIVFNIYQNFSLFEAKYALGKTEAVLDSAPEYWEFRGGGYTEGGSIERGFTQGYYDDEYVPYAEPTKTYIYSKKLKKEISDDTDLLRYDLLKPSENLLDNSKIIWHTLNGAYELEENYYMPVTAGDIVVTNNLQGGYTFYDSSYTKITGVSSSYVNRYTPITAPADAAWMRIAFNPAYIEIGEPTMVWIARNINSAPYERPIYRPHLKFNSAYADSDLFDYAVPSSLSQGVVRMARFAALRAANERQSAYRFATFNKFVSTGDAGVPYMREMAFDYGLDFMGLQECEIEGTKIAAAMYQFQLPYGTGNVLNPEEEKIISVPAVSRFEITSTTCIQLKEKRACAKIVMNMPQNKHFPRVPTLSVYNYHGSLAKANRLAEIEDMLDVIEQDTSDFIIVMGDTNSETDQQGHRQSWDAWESAGFTAVHHGESPTWPNPDGVRYSSMDNIFVSEHINVLGYDIIRATNYMIPSGSGPRPLSDHDLVFADLQFDFDAVLKDTWEEPPTVT